MTIGCFVGSISGLFEHLNAGTWGQFLSGVATGMIVNLIVLIFWTRYEQFKRREQMLNAIRKATADISRELGTDSSESAPLLSDEELIRLSKVVDEVSKKKFPALTGISHG